MGEVEDVDVTGDGVGWGEYLWVRIWLDLTKPLSRGRMLRLKEKTTWVAFQYKKIPKFCFKCGVILYGSCGCGKGSGRQLHGGEKEDQFGPWLRVASLKRCYGHGGGWHRESNKEYEGEESSNGPGRKHGGDNGGSGDQQGGRTRVTPTSSAHGGKGSFGNNETLHGTNKESGDSEHLILEASKSHVENHAENTGRAQFTANTYLESGEDGDSGPTKKISAIKRKKRNVIWGACQVSTWVNGIQ